MNSFLKPNKNSKFELLCINNVRYLIAEMIENANSGHPGMSIGFADIMFTLFYKYIKYDPKNPKWIGRDRFILSAGHCSSLYYVILYLFKCGININDLKKFRKIDSVTTGHPEYGITDHIEVSTGLLGSGFSTAVGIAIAAKNFLSIMKLQQELLFKDQKIYVACGDGCLMEGCLHESASLAGHLGLNNLICIYDANNITAENTVDAVLSENIKDRFISYNWRVIEIEDANNLFQIENGLDEAVQYSNKPTLVICKTKACYGCSDNISGNFSTHGKPIGRDEVNLLKNKLNIINSCDDFYVIPEIIDVCEKRSKYLSKYADEWNNEYIKLLNKNSKLKENIYNFHINTKLCKEDNFFDLIFNDYIKKYNHSKISTRKINHFVMQEINKYIPNFIGGSADLAPSTLTFINDDGYFSKGDNSKKNIHFGVRELGMGFAINGISLYDSNYISYCSTFLVFSDYVKPAIRMAAIQKIRSIYIFTHDSIYVGEDGPTHHPIEQLMMLRCIPELIVLRPFNVKEIIKSWEIILNYNGPSALILTRQDIDYSLDNNCEYDDSDITKGAYVYLKENNSNDLFTIITTGSEVLLSLKVANLLKKDGYSVRVVSMLSWEIFNKQNKEYKNYVIPNNSKKISIEIGSTFGWERFISNDGLSIGIDCFGVSGSKEELIYKYNLSEKDIFNKIIKFFIN